RMLAERFGHHPGLRGWHLHNEYGTLDHGPAAARAFRTWLQARYGGLEELNAPWTTAFWSQGYGDWEEITAPRTAQYLHNPAQLIDFRRFSSDEMRAAMCEQRDEIRAAGSTAPVTTNFMLPTWNHLEQWGWAEELDVVSIDHYLDTSGPDAEAHIAYGSDLTRSWSGGPWVLMEQNASGISLGDRTVTKSPQRMIRHSLGYIARGSQSSLFFQWRASPGGAEQWHSGLVPHAGGSARRVQAGCGLGPVPAPRAASRPCASWDLSWSGSPRWWSSRPTGRWSRPRWGSSGTPTAGGRWRPRTCPATRSPTPRRSARPTARSGGPASRRTSCAR